MIKTLKRLASAAVLLLACDKRYEGPPLTENAVVADSIYSPATHTSGVGFNTKGNLRIDSYDTDPIWVVVFECEHGKFVKEGSHDDDKRLWERMKKGSKVTIRYAEKIREDSNGRRHLVGYHFIEATVQK